MSSFLNEMISEEIHATMDHNPYADPNENFNKLSDKIIQLRDKHIPCRLVKFRKYKHRRTKWITSGIIKSIKYKDRLYKRLRTLDQLSPNYGIAKQNLTVYSKILKKTIREAKIEYYNGEFNKHKSDMRKMWNNISEIICKSKNKPNGVKAILSGGSILTQSVDMANKFNNFFINIGPSLSKDIRLDRNHNYEKYLNRHIFTSFHFELVNNNDVKKTIMSLRSKTSTGHDGISTKLLKFISPALVESFRIIINKSLITGIYLHRLKIAKVIPIYKKENKLLMDNYRPISLLSSMSKLFEKVVYNQLFTYFQKNRLLYNGQYGFRMNHSTELAAIELVDRILKDIDNKKLPLAIYMDLSKAFDTLDHNILIKKLQYYGVIGTPLNWFQSYLTDRTQYVEVNNESSSLQTILTGVPQGSILGPLLFLIYMNDIPNASNLFTFILYADDTTLFSTIEYSIPSSASNYHQTINLNLSKVTDWLIANRLSLNVKKN